MANGPLGGFMPTPPSPGQPPQVKLETSAESRGAFNKFLGTLPSNGAVAPIQTGVVPSSTAPVSPVTSNVNIFQPQMSQMAPMPMMPPAQPVQNFFMGGAAMSGGGFSDAEVGSQVDSFDSGQGDSQDNFDVGFTEEEDPDRAGDYQTDDSGIFTGTGGDDSPPPVVDTRPRTNIRNVGPTSNLRFDPQFTADLLSRRFGDDNISGFMAPADFAQTRQGGATGPISTGGLPSLGLGQNLLTAKPTVSRQDVLTAANRLSDIAPAATVPLAPTSPFFDRDLLDDPLGLGIRTGFGPAVDAIEEGRARARAFPSVGTPVAGLPTIVPGVGGTQDIPGLDAFGGFGDPARPIRTIEDDLIQGAGKLEQRSGANINNPGNIRAGGGFDGEIGRTRDGFAIFDSMKSGVDAIGKLATTYGKKRNINTVREFSNRYSPPGENTAKQIAGKINVISNALGVGPDEKVDFTDPNVQAILTPAVITSEIGADKTRDVANVLKGFNLSQLSPNLRDLNPNVTSNVDQLATLDPIQTPIDQGIIPVGEFNVTPPSVVPDEGILPVGTFDVTEKPTLSSNLIPSGSQFGKGSAVSAFPNIRPNLQEQVARGIRDSADRDAAALSLGIAPFTRPDTRVDSRVRGTGDAVENLLQAGRREELLNRGARAQEISNIQRALDRGTVAEDLDRPISFVDSDPVADSTTIKDVDQELSPIVAAGIGAPKEFSEPFPDAGINIFGFRIPTLTSGLNALSNFSRQRVFDAVLNKGATPVYDGDVLVGAKINGVLVEGMDPNAPTDSGDNEDPIEKFLKKATEDKEKEEKDTTPNVIGGGTPRKTLENVPTVVSSPFQARNINFRPVGFDAGNLNKLIERITGVPSPRRMQDGGTVAAVDRFLSKVA